MNARSFRLAADGAYADAASSLFEALGATHHVVLVHETVLTGELPDTDDDDGGWYDPFYDAPPAESRAAVNAE
jgi:hypothetical protein